jgi:hypothetical protein
MFFLFSIWFSLVLLLICEGFLLILKLFVFDLIGSALVSFIGSLDIGISFKKESVVLFVNSLNSVCISCLSIF